MRLELPLSILLLGVSCASPRSSLPRIADLYSDAAQRETRNPVIVIHGILGARLEERATGRSAWGAFSGDYFDPNSEDGARAIGLPLTVPASAHDYDPERETIVASGPLEALSLNVLFTVVSVEVYANIIRTLGAGGYTDNVAVDPFSPAYSEDHFSCFSFFYDWRRDNVENAIQLGKFIEARREEIARNAGAKIERLRAEGTAEAKHEADELEAWLASGYRFDIVAHSMGGLVARYYLRYGANDLPSDGSLPTVTWEGAEEIDRLILVGTPSFGAMNALENLVRGFTPAPILPHFDAALLGTMPSIYQLLPRMRHRVVVDEDGAPSDVDLTDVNVWEQNRWGLFADSAAPFLEWMTGESAESNRAKAKNYVAWCLDRAKAFHAALDQKPGTPCRSRLYLFASDTEDTSTRTLLEERKGRLVPTFDRASLRGPGDGTVPRASAVADERFGDESAMWLQSPIPWTNVTFFADDHIGLTSNPHFSNNALFILLMTEPPQ